MKWSIKGKVIGILTLILVVGTLGMSIGTSLNKEVIISSRETKELKGLTTSTYADTKKIIDAHKNDFNYNNFRQKIKNYDDYISYLKSLGGVFAKYAEFDGRITTYSELEEVANYVYGIIALWGFDYSANGGDRYFSYYGSDRFYPNQVVYNKENYGNYGIDTVASGGGNGMLANCNLGVDWTLRKAGLMEMNDAMSFDFYFSQSSMISKYNATKITNANDIQPGDFVIIISEGGGFHTTICAARDDVTKKITYFDSGSVALHQNLLTEGYKNVRNIGDSPWPWEVETWYAIRLPHNLQDDTSGQWRTNDNGTWFRRPDGTFPKNQWVKIVGEWYHFDQNGYLQKGLTKINDKWYYLDPTDGKMLRGWQTVNGFKRYFAPKQTSTYVYGQMYTGLNDIKDSNGNTYTYYFDSAGKMTTGLVEVNNNKYYFGSDGKMIVGWQKIDNRWYYFSKDSGNKGQMATGWKNLERTMNGKTAKYWFFFVESDGQYPDFVKGQLLIGRRLVSRDGKSNYYYFCTSDNKVEGYPIGAMLVNGEYNGMRYDESGIYIDEIAPQVVKITYSTKELTSQNVSVVVQMNEKVQPISGWTLSEDGLKLGKVYSNNTEENITVKDLAGNSTIVSIKVNNIDKTAPVCTVKYNTTKPTMNNVVVTITSDEAIQETTGWTLNDDKKSLTKEYADNIEEDVVVKDIAGNESIIHVKVDNIDRVAPQVTYSSSETGPTSNYVTITITANEKIQRVTGWTLSEDGLTLTKEYTINEEESVLVKDLAGNTTKIEIKVENIDNNAMNLTLHYSTKEVTSENVIVTITSDEIIQEVEGWTLSEDKLTLTKEYTENKEERITVKDLAGNEVIVGIVVDNIDKIAPEIEVSYSNKELTNKSVTVSIRANEKIKSIAGWVLDEDELVLTKKFNSNVKDEIEVSDIAGNKIKAEFEIENIYETKIDSTRYVIDGDMIVVKDLKVTVNEFKDNITTTAQDVKLININDKEINENDLIGTESKLILDGTLVYRIVVLGDYDGDGKVAVKEVAQVQKTILQSITLDDIHLKAFDLSENGRIDVKDLARVCKIVLNQNQ